MAAQLLLDCHPPPPPTPREGIQSGAVVSQSLGVVGAGCQSLVVVCNAVGPQSSRLGQLGHRPLGFSLALLSSSHSLAVHSC